MTTASRTTACSHFITEPAQLCRESNQVEEPVSLHSTRCLSPGVSGCDVLSLGPLDASLCQPWCYSSATTSLPAEEAGEAGSLHSGTWPFNLAICASSVAQLPPGHSSPLAVTRERTIQAAQRCTMAKSWTESRAKRCIAVRGPKEEDGTPSQLHHRDHQHNYHQRDPVSLQKACHVLHPGRSGSTGHLRGSRRPDHLGSSQRFPGLLFLRTHLLVQLLHVPMVARSGCQIES